VAQSGGEGRGNRARGRATMAVSWFLLLCVCVMILVLLAVNVYMLIHYQHPDDKSEAWGPKALVVSPPDRLCSWGDSCSKTTVLRADYEFVGRGISDPGTPPGCGQQRGQPRLSTRLAQQLRYVRPRLAIDCGNTTLQSLGSIRKCTASIHRGAGLDALGRLRRALGH
jgi:hypothetical protein